MPAQKTSVHKKQNSRAVRKADTVFLSLASASVLLLVFLILPAEEYSLLQKLKDAFSALAGNMNWTLFLYFAALAAFRYVSAQRKVLFSRRAIMLTGLYIGMLSAVESFFVSDLQNAYSYVDQLQKAWDLHLGGGFLGALLACPITTLLSPWGALAVFLVLMALCFIGLDVFSFASKSAPKGKPMNRSVNASARNSAKSASAKRGLTFGEVRQLFVEKQAETADVMTSDDEIRLPHLSKKDQPVHERVPAPKNGQKIPEVVPNAYSVKRNKKTNSEGNASAKAAYDPFVTVKKSEHPAAATFNGMTIEQIDLMDSIRNENKEQRNSRYRNNALHSHAKPVTPAGTASKPVPQTRQAPSYSMPSTAPVPETAEDTALENLKPIAVSKTLRPVSELPEEMDLPEEEFEEEYEEDFEEESENAIAKAEEVGAKASEADDLIDDVIPVKPPQMPKPSFFDASSITEKKPVSAVKPEAAKQKEMVVPYVIPPFNLLQKGASVSSNAFNEEDMRRAEILTKTLQKFKIPIRITGITHGPTVTTFEFLPADGIKVNSIPGYQKDISMAMSATVRVEAPIPNRDVVGVEVPNKNRETVYLRDILESEVFQSASSPLTVVVGKDNEGKYVCTDLAKMPHLLIAGQTGSGKSVCINTFIISILYRSSPDEVKMIMIDPKMVELSCYNAIPHLLMPVVTDPKKAANVLDWTVGEMMRRYDLLKANGAKNIDTYNKKLPEGAKPMPRILVIIDELADLMLSAAREVEASIAHLTQLARAAGINLVIATQRPSVDVVTGLIKNNIPGRIAFKVSSGVDSRTILDCYAAEKLLSHGDMLFQPNDQATLYRIQGPWVSEEEVDRVVEFIAERRPAEFDQELIDEIENASLSDADKADKAAESANDEVDPLFAEAIKICIDAKQASISLLRRRLRLGHDRAGRVIDEMAQRGFITANEGSKPRDVLITMEEYNQLFGTNYETNEDSSI